MVAKKKQISLEEKSREILGILTMVVGVFVLLSLVSHESTEELSIMPGVHFHNWMGYLGIFISWALFKMFLGWGSLMIAILIGIWGYVVFSEKDFQPVFRFTGYSFGTTLILMTLFAMIAEKSGMASEQLFRHSGYLVVSIGQLLKDFLGFPGAILILLSIGIVTIQAWRGFSFRHVNDWIEDRISQLRNKFNLASKKRAKVKDLKARSQAPIQREEEVAPSKATPAPIPGPAAAAVPPPIQREEIPPQNLGKAEQTTLKPNEIEIEDAVIEDEVDYDETQDSVPKREYKLPSVDLLMEPPPTSEGQSKDILLSKAELLIQTLETFGVDGRVTNIAPGPVITRYEVEPGPGIRVSKIANLSDDIARVMEAQSVRIIAPIPGKNSVGIELPNDEPEIVYFKSGINSPKFSEPASVLTIALGKTTAGEIFVADLAKMPHLLVAGATGSGKSVCINTIITSLLYRARPDQVKFIMIDPKKLELSTYKRLQGYHLITSESIDEYVITTPKNAIHALRSAELEMEKRYNLLSKKTVRNIDQYNERATGKDGYDPLPYIIVLVDELADLMITAGKEIEEPIARLAQMARAVGIHLVIATQRPSVDVITGVIKANFPTRIAFKVAQKNDSRTILDQNGAEKLLGRGDMLFLAPGAPAPVRLHNAFVTLEEIEDVLDHIQEQPKPEEELLPGIVDDQDPTIAGTEGGGEVDPLFDDAYRLVVLHQQGSVSMIQRRLRVGYARAGRLIDELERAGIVGPNTGSKARDVLVGPEVLDNPSFDEDILDD
ncbi:MAG: DNA translocase FtsK [Candidatus Marinimicrobia bacterium]|jgi:DNA segregation ATPase FtsK/SpoIIIE, S-DNA-T family|nr:DNA translocase FtsK [Candidatus Neomarinimicrobiota bacterium]MBT4361557.1 DNA translocase FtsK [Candidatus Neomarinimicrobiota bacterium]MBT4714314.1 DNA translocase FtsK [Candidatus Neomarinimicrobiota bacterium]MBT4944865.1 DNA translocase FtsK [Candidatus Neomarinimicrobiota bacterium]MBT5271564.1 DNA translocase FtsK [Candidatus Neomarinimicrobiota bacterium]